MRYVPALVPFLAFTLAACGDDGSDPDPGDVDAAAVDAPAVDAPAVDSAPACARTQANPCPMDLYPGGTGYYQNAGSIDAMSEHVYYIEPAETGQHRLAGTAANTMIQFSISTNVALACAATGSYCSAGQPCGGVNVQLTAGTRYFVKVCNVTAFDGVQHNVTVSTP